MFFRRWKIITGVILFSFVMDLCYGYRIVVDSEKKDGFMHEAKLLMESLERALNFFVKRPETITGDVVLGVLIAKANLQWIYGRLKSVRSSNSRQDEHLGMLLRRCRGIIKASKSGSSGVLDENLWKNAAGNLRYGLLNQHDDEFSLPEFGSCQSIDAYMMKGTPEDSDFCIKELISSRCEVSEYCWLSESNEDFHSGYGTTHRLLYFQIALKMKCDEINPKKFSGITQMKTKLCQQMFLEASGLFKKPSISMTRDLFMEQIALCGLEGYEEFAFDVWRHRVRDWQNLNGCFSLDTNLKNCSVDVSQKNNSTVLIKRTDSVIDGCHTHVTAVGVSALAFFLRVTLKMAFNLP